MNIRSRKIFFLSEAIGPIRYFSFLYEKLKDKYEIDIFCPDQFNIFSDKKILKNLPDVKDYDLVIVAAAWGSTSDKIILNECYNHNVQSIAIVDHWSWYKERFDLNGKEVLPSYILLNDNFSKEQCVGLGFDDSILLAYGNPVLENRWNSELDYFLSESKKKIIFLSEDYANSFKENSIHDNGFNEYSVVNDILENMDSDQNLYIKLHPKENKSKFNHLKDKVTIIEAFEDIDKYLIESEFIIGMGSMLLLEAALIRKDVISYRPNEKVSFVGNHMNATYLIKDSNILRKVLKKEMSVNTDGLSWKFFEGSTKRIFDFLEGLLNESR